MHVGTIPDAERRHNELIDVVEQLAAALRTIGKQPDVVVNVPAAPRPHVHIDNSGKLCSYEFLVHRDKANRIQSIVATPITIEPQE